MEKKKVKWAWLKKFGYAFRGIYTSVREETSLVVHLVVAAIVLVTAAVLTNYSPLSPAEWAILVFVIGTIIGMELINTAVENLVDVVSFKYNYNAKKIKDVSAAATLVLTITAVAVGLIIFIPHIIELFK
ncbi:MAG: diacylglycerol kinase family protein [Mycoplasmataceae bacterium]|nr:diacylglycerol kinase family protein [Mycoplasmataceae bacterium]